MKVFAADRPRLRRSLIESWTIGAGSLEAVFEGVSGRIEMNIHAKITAKTAVIAMFFLVHSIFLHLGHFTDAEGISAWQNLQTFVGAWLINVVVDLWIML